ncbi:hypothetical protein [Halarcobacter ebronensis]|uniref:Uncharacterized protein n=1 Tax=Halarcobacter ebronensis TaxID=1462615 RepID=A0A4Q1B096_9BACT|nr:hypothetical protein [Halarcobacter ebronensis]QKF80612.1 hypothetical protein AEBR_0094 [Halarcobacter ebronensis]RXK08413.1 hypothetical protein CRV07_01015 [Halarcobacter ebronensis]
MVISSSNNFFNEISSNIQKRSSTDTINNSFKVHKEYDVELTAFTQKVEGDYSTYSAKELSELSYNEIKANYEEIKEILEARMEEAKDTINSESFKNYQKRLLLNDDIEVRGGSQDQQVRFEESFLFLNEDEITEDMLDKQYGQITRENTEIQDLLNFNDKFKIVNYFDNDQINRAIYSKYEDNSQVFYDYSNPVDLDGSEVGYRGGTSYTIQGTDLKQILQSIEDALEFIEKYGVQKYKDPESSRFSAGFIIQGDEITIAGKKFSIYDVKKNENDDIKKEEIKETESTNEVKTESEEDIKPDYSTYTAAQLRQITFDEAKENLDELKKILEDNLKNVSKLNKEDTDNLLAFKAQLDKVDYLKDDTLNEAIYNKLQTISDPKVAVWSDLAITENIENLQNGNLDSLIINGLLIYASDLQTKEDTDEKENKNENASNTQQQKETTPLNLDSIINIVSNAAKNASQNSQDTYKQEVIEAYSNFISQYSEIRNSLLHSF